MISAVIDRTGRRVLAIDHSSRPAIVRSGRATEDRGDRPSRPPFKPRTDDRADRPYKPAGDRPFRPRTEDRGDRPSRPPFKPRDRRSGRSPVEATLQAEDSDRAIVHTSPQAIGHSDRAPRTGVIVRSSHGPTIGERPFKPRTERPLQAEGPGDRPFKPSGDRPFRPKGPGDRPFRPGGGGGGGRGPGGFSRPPSGGRGGGFRPAGWWRQEGWRRRPWSAVIVHTVLFHPRENLP